MTMRFSRRATGRQVRHVGGVEFLEERRLLAIGFDPAAVVYDVGGGPIAIGDFNSDGKPDLAVVSIPQSGTGGTVSILLNIGEGSFGTPASVLTGLANVTGLAVGDMYGDGKLDLVATDYQDGEISIIPGRGDGTFGSPTVLSDANMPSGPIITDVNGDGKLDILVSTKTGTDLFLNQGDGTFALHAGVVPFGAITFADFNGDGKVDLAGIIDDPDTYFPELAVSRGNGDGTFAAPVISPLPAGPLGLPTLTGREYLADGTTIPADFNGDSRPDLVFSDYGEGVAVLLNDGKGGFVTSAGAILTTESNTVVGDFNGDGKPEVADASQIEESDRFPLAYALSILPNNGDGTLGTPVDVLDNPNGLGELAAADFDGDGKLDIVFTDGSTTGVLLSGIHTPPTLNPIANQPGVGGSTVTVQAAAYDDDPRAAITYSASTGTIDPKTGSFSYTATGVGTVDVTITATVVNASPPLSVSESFQIAVKAPPPEILTFPALPNPVAGVAWTGVGSYFADGVPVASVDYGDGTGASPLIMTTPAEFTLAHTYASPGFYNVTISLTDADGGTYTDRGLVLFVAPSAGSGGFGHGGGSSAVRVTSITTTVAKGAITAFKIQFDGPVANAAAPNNYGLLLVTTKKVRKKLVTTTKRLRIKSVSYDVSADVAQIVPAGRLAPGKVNELTINTPGLFDLQGRPLGGELIADIRGKVVTIR